MWAVSLVAWGGQHLWALWAAAMTATRRCNYEGQLRNLPPRRYHFNHAT